MNKIYDNKMNLFYHFVFYEYKYKEYIVYLLLILISY